MRADEHFLLRSPLARRLYHEIAAPLPIIDYHCHLDPGGLAKNQRFQDLTKLWIEPDPYKHRALRLLGVPEEQITGPATPREKFQRWAEAVPQLLGTALFHWSALELKRYFGIDEMLTPTTADAIWDQAAQRLQSRTHAARGLLESANAETVCTSDGWLDDLASHRFLAEAGWRVRMLPSLRADEVFAIEQPTFGSWMERLSAQTGVTIQDGEALLAALDRRLDVFAAHHCVLADHGIDALVYEDNQRQTADEALRAALRGVPPSQDQAQGYRSWLLFELGQRYAARGWAMQLHLGAHRTTSSRLRRLAGPAGGYATIGKGADVGALCRLIDALERQQSLPRMILYPLNPADYAKLATLTGSFAEDGIRTKIQLGPAWWYNDHANGIRGHLDAVSHYGVLRTFIGMTTDSRCLLSLSRHEYFRRLLCDYLGEQAQAGAYPDDLEFLAGYVRAIACENAREWLRIPSAA